MLDRDRRYRDCLDEAMQAASPDEALAWLDEALRVQPEGAEAHNLRGELHWDQGRCEESLRDFLRAAEAQPDFHSAQLNRVEILIEEFQQHEQALSLCDRLLTGKPERSVEAEVFYLKAKALFYLDDLDASLFLLRRAIKVYPDVGVYFGFEGQILFELGKFESAADRLERARGLDPSSAHTLYHLALVLEHQGDHSRAEQLFGEAEAFQPEIYPRPVRIELDEFEAAAEQALKGLPPRIRDYAKNCPVLIEDLPERELVQSDSISPQVLGLFTGTPATQPGASPTMGTAPRIEPDRILLFKRNLEKAAATREELEEQIQITVMHEIGHYLGMDEEEIEHLGLG